MVRGLRDRTMKRRVGGWDGSEVGGVGWGV